MDRYPQRYGIAIILAMTVGVVILAALGTLFVIGLFSLADAATTPCVNEDSRSCIWDASTQGNGAGRSFIDVAGATIPLN